jgi:hypothetical protein
VPDLGIFPNPRAPAKAPAGKPKKQAVGACMRKLVMLCYGVLKNRARFDPDWVSRKAPENTLPG